MVNALVNALVVMLVAAAVTLGGTVTRAFAQSVTQPATQSATQPVTPSSAQPTSQPIPPSATQPTSQPAVEVRPTPLVWEWSVALDDGRVKWHELLATLFDAAGMDGQWVRDHLRWETNVTDLAGQLQLAGLRAAAAEIMAFEIEADRLVMTIDRLAMRRQSRALRARLRALVVGWFPEDAAAAMGGYGLWVATGENAFARPDADTLKDHVVVLVHGLDEPGDLWAQMTPALLKAGHVVMEFRYPNDQPIVDSAVELDAAMGELDGLGVKRVSLVTHSMGGLVSRQMLTSSACYAGRGSGREGRPNVDRLIMIGTPNHGSALARLHVVSEVRDQISRALSGDGLLFGAVYDGAGEAQLDLLPDSPFLAALNARPHPEGVAMTIIAGRASPVTPAALMKLETALSGKLHGRLGAAADSSLSWLTRALAETADGVGDGCVSIESARLVGVDDFVIVEANHVSLVRQVIDGLGKTPPAIAVVLDRLHDPDAAPDPDAD